MIGVWGGGRGGEKVGIGDRYYDMMMLPMVQGFSATPTKIEPTSACSTFNSQKCTPEVNPTDPNAHA